MDKLILENQVAIMRALNHLLLLAGDGVHGPISDEIHEDLANRAGISRKALEAWCSEGTR